VDCCTCERHECVECTVVYGQDKLLMNGGEIDGVWQMRQEIKES
jgi:hypothetical protein